MSLTRERVEQICAENVMGHLLKSEILALCDHYLQSATAEADEWQLIATAPKNRRILLCWPKHNIVRSGRYDVDDDFYTRPRGWVSPAEGWRNDGDQCIPRNQDDCTHWMPLPSALTPKVMHAHV